METKNLLLYNVTSTLKRSLVQEVFSSKSVIERLPAANKDGRRCIKALRRRALNSKTQLKTCQEVISSHIFSNYKIFCPEDVSFSNLASAFGCDTLVGRCKIISGFVVSTVALTSSLASVDCVFQQDEL